MPATAHALLSRYHQALNERDTRACLALVSEDVLLDLNQGAREVGRAAFAAFIERTQRCYRESIEDPVILGEPSGRRAACEFTLNGEYLATDEGLPDAFGQRYRLAAGAFFEIRQGRIARISHYFNLPDWLARVDA
ncbi:MAG: ketosteroid isomerase-related protein [Ensifer adhaerens]